MSKRFTDPKKWRNPWFRSLSMKAKLLWIHLTDECDVAGFFKIDFELVSFMVGFKVEASDLNTYFGEKILLLTQNEVLIVPFFNFQYRDSKDTWSAKVKAKKLLELRGFLINDNDEIIVSTHSDPTVGVQSTTVLLRSISRSNVIIRSKEESKFKVSDAELEEVYKAYPRKEGKKDGFDIARSDLKSKEDLEKLRTAIARYNDVLQRNKTESKFIKLFSTFMSSWRDCLDPDYGTTSALGSGKFTHEEMMKAFGGPL